MRDFSLYGETTEGRRISGSQSVTTGRLSIPSNAPVRVRSLVVKWRRLISCTGIIRDEIYSQIRYALLLWKHSAEKPLECLLRVPEPQWWVYDIWLAIEVTMFTGIVEEVGHVARIEQHGEDRRLTITASNTPKELNPGDSVAVSGVCLTAVNISGGSFCADLAPETWARTSFSRMHEGALVNLELPMKANGRFGGHIVQGHVDGVGKHHWPGTHR